MTHEIGKINGIDYTLIRDKMHNQGGYEFKTLRWFLTIDGSFVGDFARKKDALAFVESYKY